MNHSRLSIAPVPLGRLSRASLEQWSELQKADPAFGSPFFRPEFALAAAEAYEDIEVAVMEQQGAAVGFFAYQRVCDRLALPVGGVMSHFHGVVVAAGQQFSPRELLQACGLVSWDFGHLLAEQAEFQEFHCARSESPFLDFSRGYDAYLAERRQAGKKEFFKHVVKAGRRLESEVGPLRFECPATDKHVLDTVLRWKSNQYRHTKTLNLIELPGTRPLLEAVFRTHTPDFSAMPSALYAGDRLVSVDYGIRSGPVLHQWLGAYDPTLPSRYSPGHVLTLEMAKAAERLGIAHVNLGRGPESYKRNWMSGVVRLAEGVVDLRALPRLLKATTIRTREWVRTSSLRIPARSCKRFVRPIQEWLMFRSAKLAAHSGAPPSMELQ